MRGVLLCILEIVEGGLCSLEVMRGVLLCILEAVEGMLCLLGGDGAESAGDAGGDALCATLYEKGGSVCWR